MAKLSKEQQAELATKLDRLYDDVCLLCDGYLVTAGMRRVDKNNLAIVVYVNGRISLAWMTGPAEEAKRFWRPSVRNKFSPKHTRELTKIYGKREAAKRGFYDKVTNCLPYWSRPTPFIRHLIKHNESIEVLDYETYKTKLAEYKASQASQPQEVPA